MNRSLCVIDGEVVPLERATVSVLDRGFLYGDAVFETLRTYGGEPFRIARHLERLERSASVLGITIPVSAAVIESEVRTALRDAGSGERYVRITVTRGAGHPGLDPTRATAARRIVLVMPLELPPSAVYEQGIRAVTFASARVASKSPSRGAKSGNYLESILAIASARESGASDALMLDADDHVIQGASSNAFFVSSGGLVTPPLEAGILDGVTRGVVLDICASLGLPVELRAPAATELVRFDEVLLTSSIREIAPVVRIDGVDVGAGRPGPVCARLRAEFAKKTGSN